MSTASATPPGPGRLLFLRHRPEVFTAMQQKYGDVLMFTIGRRSVFLVSRPDLIAQIHRDHYAKFEKAWGPRRGHPVLDKGLVTSEGADHRAQRQQFSKLFSRNAVAEQRPAMAEVIEEWGSRQRSGETIDLVQEMSLLATDIVARVMFGSRVDTAAAVELGNVVMRGFRKIIIPLLNIKPEDPTPYAVPIVEQLRRNRYREGLLSALFDMPDSDAHIRTFLIAGQETIRLAVAWSWFLLSAHPEARARLQAEARSGADPLFAEAVLQESMRLYPPQWMVGKKAIEDYQLGDYVVPRGGIVLMSQYIVQRDERWFPDAQKFVPERWLEGSPSPAYFPFGGGVRRCIGEAFALTEGTMMLSLLSRDWTFECNSRDGALDTGLTLKPRRMRARMIRH